MNDFSYYSEGKLRAAKIGTPSLVFSRIIAISLESRDSSA